MLKFFSGGDFDYFISLYWIRFTYWSEVLPVKAMDVVINENPYTVNNFLDCIFNSRRWV